MPATAAASNPGFMLLKEFIINGMISSRGAKTETH
jgi:hypothetical protein